jgi:hypothetical protein
MLTIGLLAVAAAPGVRAQAGASGVVDSHMAESIRADIRKLVVVGGYIPAGETVTGSYEQETAGLIGGMDEGARIGTISKEVGGVPINIPIPVIGTLGSIYGGISGAAEREIQEFRDALTEELVSADSPALSSNGLALDAFWSIRRIPTIDSHLFAPAKPVPEDVDAVLDVTLNELIIDVQGDEAVITASAAALLLRPADNRAIYATEISYQDRDSLDNWTKDDNALWRAYVNYARFFLGRAIAADVFDEVALERELAPAETESTEFAKRSKSRLEADSVTPTLAWVHRVKGGAVAWATSIDESATTWDLEIFDNRTLVYQERDLPDPTHLVSWGLEPCRGYRWSVRPVYHVAGDVRFGEWMQMAPPDSDKSESESPQGKGRYGREASLAPAYTQDFAQLNIACDR